MEGRQRGGEIIGGEAQGKKKTGQRGYRNDKGKMQLIASPLTCQGGRAAKSGTRDYRNYI